MKTSISYSLIAAAMACGFANAQTTAYTTPVGYITANILPNVSNSESGSATFIASSLVQPAVFAGAAVSSPSGGNVITFSGGVPALLDSTYVLEISDGAQQGWYSAITSSGSAIGTTITVMDAFPASLSASVTVTVRKFTTIQNVFGDNSPGLGATDEIQVLDPATQVASVVIYAGGWFDQVTEEPAGGVIIYPGTAVKVIHRDNTTLSVVSSGEVKTTSTQVDVFDNDNWLGQPNPTGGTFGTMQLATQVLTTDFVNLIKPDEGTGQPTESFQSVSNVMYNIVTEEDATTQPVSQGNGYLLSRASGGSTTITIPAQVVAP
jgi:hypothetical protein